MPLPHHLYIGTIGEGLWRSLDGGVTFARDYNGLFVECHVRALAVEPRDPKTIYLGCELGLFRSTDGAANWSCIDSPINGQQVWSILQSPTNPDVLLVGTCPSRVFRSGDGGKTWEEAKIKIVQNCPRIMHTRVTTLRADPVDPLAVWAGVEIDGLFKSRDTGRTWQPVGTGLSSRDIHGLAIVPGNGRGKRMLASTNNDLNLSTDGGETWQPLQVGRQLPWSYCRGLAQMSGRPEVVFMVNGDGPPGTIGAVARSTDAGATWHIPNMPGRSNSTIWTFGVHGADPQLVYAPSVSGEIYRSTDGGGSWEKLSREFGEVRAIAWSPS
jgi:photosystem II stability/assembly factor-like uncharacterized protein